jgi:glycosyltransferase involved in cell wall biosynthesis
MRLSFVIPTLNQGPFIRRCIDSCLAQGIADSEILVQDGGSTDGTREILRGYGDRVAWTSAPDRGQGDAVNKGVSRARGEVVAWINSDDYYPDPDCLSAVLAEFDRDAEVDIVYGDGVVVDVEGTVIRPYRNRPFASARDLIVEPVGLSQPASFFRRSTFLAVGGLRTDLYCALDYDLFIRLFQKARRVRRVPRTLACMTFHPDAKSTRAMLRQIREATRLKAEYARTNGLGVVDLGRLAIGVGKLYAYWLAVRTGMWRAA